LAIVLILNVLYLKFAKQQKIVKYILIAILCIVILSTVFVLGFIKGKYDINDDFVSIVSIIMALFLCVSIYLSNRMLNK